MQVATKKTANVKQQECIDSINGQIMVLAGPGTGKTFTLIERIKNMLSKGILPDKILCLTFSEAAATEMKKRLVVDIGPIGSDVNVYTYHGFCNEIIANNPDDFIQYSSAKLISDSTKRAFVKQIIDDFDLKALRTEGYNAYYYIPEILRAIADIKKNLIAKDEFFNNLKKHPDWGMGLEALRLKVAEKLKKGDNRTKTDMDNIKTLEAKIAKADEIWQIYERYTQLMQENNFIDFSDMINLVLQKFKESPEFASRISNQFEYFLVDEYQDTNKAQNLIVFNLVHASEGKNVFVVGDDDQIIYGFQGAQLDNVEKFLLEFPDTKVICLNENMRSTQSILDFSYEIVKGDTRRLEINPDFSQYGINKRLTSKNPDIIPLDKKVRFKQFEELEQEQNYIVSDIEKIINSSSCPVDKNGKNNLSQIAILTRSNSELQAFADKLKAKNIPFELKEGKNIFQVKSAQLLYLYMKLLANPCENSDKIFSLLLNNPFSINLRDYEKLLIQKHLHHNDFFIDDMREMNPQSFVDKDKIEDTIRTYEYLKSYATRENLKNTVLEIANKTGILKHFMASEINQFENIMGIKKLIDEAQGLSELNWQSSLEDFVEYLNVALENEIQILTDKSPVPLNAIQLLTYHSSKGREFEHVYLPTLEAYKWERNTKTSASPYVPTSAILSKEEKDEIKASERIKLLFVGVTRAKHTLTLSYPIAIGGKGRKLTKHIPFDEEMLEYDEYKYDADNFLAEKIGELLKTDFDYKKEFSNYIMARINDLKLSATSVNMYLKCPKQFFFSKILEFAIKDGNKDHISYGNAVHKACQQFLDFAIKNAYYPTKEEFLKFFEDDFANRQISTKKCRQDLLDRAKNNLPTFYNQLIATPIKNLYCAEYKIPDYIFDGTKIVGFIDRIEKLEDGTFALYDYKTGKSKAKEIEDGKTHEDYLNQLRLYKFIFEKTTGNIVSKTGFIFPDDCLANCEKPLTENDNKIIEEKLHLVNDNIRKMNFEAKPQNDLVCKDCLYRDICSLEGK